MRARLLAFLLVALAVAPALAYRAGDTVRFHVIPRGLSGVAEVPTLLKAYVYRDATCVDSLKGIGNDTLGPLTGMTAYPLAGANKAVKAYTWTWDIPTSYGLTSGSYYTGNLHVLVRMVGTGIVQDWLEPVPSLVPVNAAAADTVTAYETGDWFALAASSILAVVTPGSYGASTVTYQGTPVTGAIVKLTNNADASSVVTWGLSDATGSYRLHTVVNAAAADTFYLWAWRGTQVVKSAEQIAVP